MCNKFLFMIRFFITLFSCLLIINFYTFAESQKENVSEKSPKIQDKMTKYNIAPSAKYNYHLLFEYHKDKQIYSDQEIALLKILGQRNLELENLEEKLILSKQALQEYISQLKKQQDQIVKFSTQLEELIQKDQETVDQQIIKLAKIYSSMEARDVAKIFNELDIQDLLPIIKNMNETNLTQVFSAMKTNKVKSLTLEMMKSNASQINSNE